MLPDRAEHLHRRAGTDRGMALKRELGVVSVFSVAAGAMVSSGLFVLPAIAFAAVGPGVFLCYLLAALLLLPTVLSKGELMAAMPKAGGTYYFIDRSLGPGFGTVGGVASWASLAFKSAFALLGIGALATFVWPQMGEWQMKAVACGFCLVFMALNALGAKHAGLVQSILVALLVGLLLAFVVGGIGGVEGDHYAELLPRGWNSLLSGAAMVFVSFGGLTKVATLGEEVRRPKRDLLLGMFCAYVVIGLLYVAVVFVAVGLLPAWGGGQGQGWPLAPISAAAGRLWGSFGAVLMGVAALCAFLTTGNAGILSASRTIMAMGQDKLLPRALGAVSRKRAAPVPAVALTSAFMIAAILLLPLGLLVKAASAMMILLFMFEMLSVVLMRESQIPTYRPTWRCPFYPWTQLFGLVCYGFLLVELGTVPLAVAAAVVAGAVAWYWLFAKVHVLRESALVRLAARLAAADFKDHDIEAELSRVARERDGVLLDRFDRLIEKCTVLDVEGSPERDELFGLLSVHLARQLGRPAEQVCELLKQRENLSSTVVRPGLAIPHLILEGIDSFVILLARCREGVKFADEEPPVHAVFVLAASPRERNFYLQALVAIAEIAQEEDFDKKWMRAAGVEAMREVVLAAERRRNAFDGKD